MGNRISWSQYVARCSYLKWHERSAGKGWGTGISLFFGTEWQDVNGVVACNDESCCESVGALGEDKMEEWKVTVWRNKEMKKKHTEWVTFSPPVLVWVFVAQFSFVIILWPLGMRSGIHSHSLFCLHAHFLPVYFLTSQVYDVYTFLCDS